MQSSGAYSLEFFPPRTPEGVEGELMVGAQPYAMFDMKLKTQLETK